MLGVGQQAAGYKNVTVGHPDLTQFGPARYYPVRRLGCMQPRVTRPTYCLLLNTQYSILNTQYSILNTPLKGHSGLHPSEPRASRSARVRFGSRHRNRGVLQAVLEQAAGM